MKEETRNEQDGLSIDIIFKGIFLQIYHLFCDLAEK